MKRKMGIVLVMALCIGITVLSGCGSEKDSLSNLKSEALKSVENIKTSDYMKEDRDGVNELINNAKDKLKNAKNEDEIKKIGDDLIKELSKVPTRKTQIETLVETLKANLSSLDSEKKSEAEKIIADYENQLSKVDTKTSLSKFSKEITDKISSQIGEEIKAVEVDEISDKAIEKEKTASGNVKETKSTNKTSSSASSSEAKPATTSNSSSSSSSNNSSTTKAPEKKQVWVVDKAAWTETKTKYKKETRYRPTWIVKTPNGNKTFYNEADAVNFAESNYYAYSDGEDEEYSVDVPYTETINHPAQGHWEYK